MDGEDARERYFAAAEKRYEKQIASLYRDALNEIRAEIGKIYEKYAKGGILTKAEMTRYNRLVSLEKSIQEIMKPVIRKSIGVIDKLKPEEYAEAFFRTAYVFDNNVKAALNWGPLDKPAIIANLENPFYEEAVKKFGFSALSRVRTAINNGLALGQSYPEMMKDLKGMINLDNYEIMRILRTELHDAQESGTADSYDEAEELGVKGKVVWIATLDGRTRDSHAAMDGVERDDDGMFRGAIGEAPYPGWEGLEAGERINCRCDIRFEVDGFAPTVRRSKEGGVIPNQNYNEWKQNRDTWK